MKKLLTALAASMMLVPAAQAVDEHHPENQASSASKPAATAPAQSPEQAVQKMQENATKMQVQLDRIAQATNPEERQKLLMEHMQTMRENMTLGQQVAMGGGMPCPMHGMMGGGMGAGMGMGPGMMMGPGGPGGDPTGMMKRMQDMERRMEMMERRLGTRAAPAK